MIREKSILRQQICIAINENDFETAQNLMKKICNDEVYCRRTWTDDETEYLMNHVNSIDYQEAIKKVAKKLDRTLLSAKRKYTLEMSKLNKEMISC